MPDSRRNWRRSCRRSAQISYVFCQDAGWRKISCGVYRVPRAFFSSSLAPSNACSPSVTRPSIKLPPLQHRNIALYYQTVSKDIEMFRNTYSNTTKAHQTSPPVALQTASRGINTQNGSDMFLNYVFGTRR